MVRSIGRRRSRAIAAVLVAYGLAGVVILGILASAVIPMTNTIDTIARSSADVSQVVPAYGLPGQPLSPSGGRWPRGSG
jgi:hypothetical protein